MRLDAMANGDRDAILNLRAEEQKVTRPTKPQATLQEIWARVLGIDASEIEPEDSFFSLGGDSIAAMKVVALARQQGHHLAIADIFYNPQLIALSRVAPRINGVESNTLQPFSLLTDITESPGALRERFANACNVSPDSVLDAYPCTPSRRAYSP